MSVPFVKYSGTGNDFVVVDAAATGLPPRPGALARRICSRREGVGVDGLIVVRGREADRVDLRFFNPDGSEFATCGNGSRCAARFAVDRGLVTERPFTMHTADADIEASVEGGRVDLEYAIEARLLGSLAVTFRCRSVEGWLVRMGTPHLVVPLDPLPEDSIEADCRPLRHDSRLGEEGANVNLVQSLGHDRLAIRTFERGVEGETLACGSGSMAAALALHAAGRCGAAVELLTRSGQELSVTLQPGSTAERGRVSRIGLAGPVERIFEGTFPVGSEVEVGAK